MASNYKYEGKTVPLTAPYQRNSGLGAQVGSIFGVALQTVANGVEGQFATEGVWELAKTDEQEWTQGQKIYWDNSGKVCTNVATAGMLIGVAMEAVAVTAGLTTGVVRLNGVAPATSEGPQTAIASFTFGTDITAATANGALTDSSAVNPTKAQFDELAKEVGTKVNDILVALRAAGIIAT
jgi:predicted RecA/RadA family phage recombinase